MAEKLVGRGQYTVVHLHSGRNIQVKLNCNHPSSQIIDKNTGLYMPDYSVEPLVITPEIQYSGEYFTSKNLISSAREVQWTINNRKPSYYNATVSGNSPFSLSLPKNLTEDHQFNIAFKCLSVEPETNLETPVIGNLTITKVVENNVTPSLVLTYPDGNLFHNGEEKTLSAISQLFSGSQDISNMCTFKWYKFVDGNYEELYIAPGISWQGANKIIVTADAFIKELNLKCVVTYGNVIYEDYITFVKRVEPYILKIENKNGDKMKNGEGVVYCEAHLYQGKKQIPDEEAEKIFKFSWTKHEKRTGAVDSSWGNRTGRKLELNKHDVDNLSTFICEVGNVSSGFPYVLPLTLN